jgi:hypothetical protein
VTTRNRLILRPVALFFGALLAGVLPAAVAGMLYGRDADLMVMAGPILWMFAVVGVPVVWFTGEDESAKWIVPLIIAALALVIPVTAETSSVYMRAVGDRVPVQVSEDSHSLFGGRQRVRVTDLATGRDLGELDYVDDRDLQVGDRLVALRDPLGWLPVSSGRSLNETAFGYRTAAVGLTLLLLLTALRVHRDLRLFARSGSRAPADGVADDPVPAYGDTGRDGDPEPVPDDVVDPGPDAFAAAEARQPGADGGRARGGPATGSSADSGISPRTDRTRPR